jgi:hypothetical protein
MNYPNLLESTYDAYIETSTMLQKIDVYAESIFREYVINKSEAELKVLTESGSSEDLDFLYTEALSELGSKVKLSMQKIVNTVKKFIEHIEDSLAERFLNKKVQVHLKELNDRVKANPKAFEPKITTEDVEELVRTLEMAIDELRKLGTKDVTENNINDLLEEANKINLSCQKRRKEIEGKKVEMSIPFGLSVLEGRIKKCRKPVNVEKQLIKLKEGASIPKQQLVMKVNGLIGQCLKEKKSIQYAGVQSLFTSIDKATKGKKSVGEAVKDAGKKAVSAVASGSDKGKSNAVSKPDMKLPEKKEESEEKKDSEKKSDSEVQESTMNIESYLDTLYESVYEGLLSDDDFFGI